MPNLIAHNQVKAITDYVPLLSVIRLTQLVIRNVDDTSTLYFTLDGSNPDINSAIILPGDDITLTSYADMRGLRMSGDLDTLAAVEMEQQGTYFDGSQYALGATLTDLRNLQLWDVPILVKESLPTQFATAVPLVYGGSQGQGLPRTQWILDLSTAQYAALYAIITPSLSKTLYIATTAPHQRSTFAIYQAIMTWPQNPNQGYNMRNGYYMGLTLEFSRMVRVV